jgi:predicted RNase H-like HicB family nuclease
VLSLERRRSTLAAPTNIMKIQAIVHKAEEGGFWAEVPSILGCATQGETMDELRSNLREAIEGCLSVPVENPAKQADDQVIELAL